MTAGHAPIQSPTPPGGTVAQNRAAAVESSHLSSHWGEANPFYMPPLLDAALASLDPDGAVRMIEARDAQGALIGRMPIVHNARHGRFPVGHAANWIHRHCFYGAPLLRAGNEHAAWEGLLATLDALPGSGAFLHLRGLDAEGTAMTALRDVCAAQGRRCEQIERYERAMLRSGLGADGYWTTNVRSKKRKELRRLQSRLAECGEISHRALGEAGELHAWVEDFLILEAKGWKGEQGTALGSSEADAAFLRAACRSAFEAGMLDMLRIDCDGRPIAMLINFVSEGGGFSFKIAIDPDFARYSPGVLIEQDNLARVLDDHVAPWMDSCAAPDHPMIDSLWGERRTIGQYRVALRKPGVTGLIGRLALPAMTVIERSYARMKSGVRT